MARSKNIYIFPKQSKRKRLPEGVGSILNLALKRYGLDKDIARYQFILHWKEIVGEEIALRAQPECIRGNALVVRVKDSTWAQELSFQKEVILKRINKFLGDELNLDDVQFYVGA